MTSDSPRRRRPTSRHTPTVSSCSISPGPRRTRAMGAVTIPSSSCAVPFTPATGPRLLVRAGLDRAAQSPSACCEALQDHAASRRLSSVHALFLDEPARSGLRGRGLAAAARLPVPLEQPRLSRASRPTSRPSPRRSARRRGASAGASPRPEFASRRASAASSIGRLLDSVYDLHRETFLRHGNEPYLTRAFFSEIARTLGDALMVKVAMHGPATPVAAAIFFWSPEALYGRYWGAAADYHSLHFETCYHQGIEFCIERGVKRFEPGTQGEHKVSRGFEPTLTWSAHYIADARFRRRSASISSARAVPSTTTPPRSASTCLPKTPRREDAVKTITWLSPKDRAGVVPAAGAGARRSRRPSGGGRRSLAGAAPRGLSARHLSLVLARPAGPLVVPRPARGALPGGIPRSAAVSRRPLRNGGFSVATDRGFRGVIDGCAAPRAQQPRHLDHAGDARGVSRAPPTGPCAQHRGAPRRASWSAVFTGCGSGAFSSANRCSAAQRDASKVALAHLVAVCRRNSIAVIDCQLASRHLGSLGAAQHPARAVPGIARGVGLARPDPLT